MKIPPERQGARRLRSPAKITPWMQVLSRRADGFHEVRVGLVPVSLYDTIAFRPLPEDEAAAGCTLELHSVELLGAQEENLVLRAARALERALGRPLRWAIRLEKAIPAGAGLGGGSGDAAATLVALNRFEGSPFSPERLAELALGLGSDVPFFLDPRPSQAEGRGEKLTVLPRFPEVPLLIVKPPRSISTAFAYSRIQPRPRPASPPAPESLEALLPLLENDFEATLFPDFPELPEIKARLVSLGAAGALLSGSGSALFGLFRDSGTRDRAALQLQLEGRWGVWACHTLQRHDYGLETP